MAVAVAEVKQAVLKILEGTASDIFLGRVERILDEGSKDEESLHHTCARIEKMVRLFIGTKEADLIERRCKDIFGKAA